MSVACLLTLDGNNRCQDARIALGQTAQIDTRNGYMFEIEAYNRMVSTEDRLEGIRAFNEKRKPVYKGQ